MSTTSAIEPRLDLHLHTTRSDGRFSPAEVIDRARDLDVIAITDHDIEPVVAGQVLAAGRQVRVVAGAEVTGRLDGVELHLLVYFPAEMPEAYRAWLRGQREVRAARYAEAATSLGLPGFSGEGAPTRAHLARSCAEAGLVRGYRDAFPFMAERGVTPFIDTPFPEAIGLARDAGGYPSWAHPALVPAQRHAAAFRKAGLEALEGVRPRLDRSTRKGLAAMARKVGLALTGGSDWHGFVEPPLGLFSWQGDAATAFLRRMDA